MAKKIYRVLIIIAVVTVIFLLGSIIDIQHPVRYLLITIGITGILTCGYYLGRKSSFDEYSSNDLPKR